MKELVYHRLFLPGLDAYADKPDTIIDGEYRSTLGQHADRVFRLAHALKHQLGVQPGDRVAVMSTNSHQYLELYHACFLGAAVINPLNLRLAGKELDYILRDSGTEVIFVDGFFGGAIAAAMAAVPIENGWTPRLLERKACCGLTWITTGQLDGAVKELRNATDVLHEYVSRGAKIVGTEPSCIAVWRSDALELLHDDPRVAEVAANVVTLAEFLAADPDFTMPDLTGHTVVAQPHCHEASVMGWAAEQRLLVASGATIVRVNGCCGLAGNHGMIAGHYDFSVKVFETNLGPALDAAPAGAIVLADGFSCRTQLQDLQARQALTFAELLVAHA